VPDPIRGVEDGPNPEKGLRTDTLETCRHSLFGLLLRLTIAHCP
jgi:hypothetical protein